MAEPEGIEWLWLENNSGKLSNERCANARYLPVMSAYLPEEASECALQLYQQEQARERGFTFGQPQSEGLDNTQQPTTEDMENNEPQRGADTWYDRALEWF
jgi:penicillin-binding protein 1B